MKIGLVAASLALATLWTCPVFAQDTRGNQSKQTATGFGVNTVFNYARSTNEVQDGSKVRNETLFLRLEPQFEYFLADGIPLDVSLGWLHRQLSRGDTEGKAAENDGLLLIGSGLHLPATPKFEIILGVRVGGYMGGSSRPTTIVENGMATTITEDTSTRGFAASGTLGSSYQVGDHAQFRAGVTYTGVFGTETITSSDTSLSTTTHNAGLSISLLYFL